MIAVDTSVWVAALRQPGSEEGADLRALIDAGLVVLPVPVRTELLIGAGGPTRDRLGRTLGALPLLYPTDATWHTIDGWTAHAGPRGERFSLGDLLIGALAADQQALLWSLDDDFRRLAALGLVRLYR